MNRTERIDRSHRRRLALGVAVSVLVHAAALALLRFDIELPSDPAATVSLVDLTDLQTLQPEVEDMQVVAITEVPVGDPISDGGGAPASSSTAAPVSASPTGIPVTSEPLLAARPDDERAFEPIVFMDPILDPATAVDFNDLVVADATPAQPSEDHPLYEPGGVGAAKKNWARVGSGAGQQGDNPFDIGFGIGVGGGHCPLPGQGGGWRF